MPIFDFTNETGERREFIVPAGTEFFQHGGESWTRAVEPVRISVRGEAVGFKEQMRRDCYRLETRPKGWKKNSVTKQTVKKVWGL
jgi:hypothetical protein